MGDADDSYDFSRLEPFVDALRDGADLVMGNRFEGGIEPGAMPALHRYLGNPVLSLPRPALLPQSGIRRFPLRPARFRRDAILALDLQTTGMEFASEMVVKATLERPERDRGAHHLYRDGRSRPPHLRTWRDGWRHLRFLLLYSPRWLFLYPGLVLVLVAGAVGAVLTFTDITVGTATFSIGTLAVCTGLVLIGYQSMWFALLSKCFASREGLLPGDRRVDGFRRRFPLEVGLILSALAVVAGVALLVGAAAGWDFSPSTPPARCARSCLP